MTLDKLKLEYTENELNIAFEAIHNSMLADKLLKENSKLVIFTIDSKLQNVLFEYFEERV